jgi:hypothetical protein
MTTLAGISRLMDPGQTRSLISAVWLLLALLVAATIVIAVFNLLLLRLLTLGLKTNKMDR